MVNKRVQNAVLGCSLKNDRMVSVHFQGKPFNITVIQVYAPTSNAEEADVERFYEDLLLLLSRFSHVQLCATPEMAAHQAPPSLGFSRQEHWSGLPFPSPIYTLGTLQSQTQFLIRAQGSSGIQGRLNGSLFVLKKPQTH